jgi:hypothetical protein
MIRQRALEIKRAGSRAVFPTGPEVVLSCFRGVIQLVYPSLDPSNDRGELTVAFQNSEAQVIQGRRLRRLAGPDRERRKSGFTSEIT